MIKPPTCSNNIIVLPMLIMPMFIALLQLSNDIKVISIITIISTRVVFRMVKEAFVI